DGNEHLHQSLCGWTMGNETSLPGVGEHTRQLPPSDDVTDWGAMHSAPDGPFTSIGTGFSHSCAFDEDIESVECWGSAFSETLTVPHF
ncbi:MAG: hypothetical protein ACI8RZ_002907, partial [Myxococcota bacterium]